MFGIVLFMLTSDSPSPCFSFAAKRRRFRALDPETLRSGLALAAGSGLPPRQIIFLADAKTSLDRQVQDILAKAPESIACSLAPKEQQSRMGIPYSISQLTAACDLGALTRNYEDLDGRRVVVNIRRSEVNGLRDALAAILNGGGITLRPRDIHLWGQAHFKRYERELLEAGLDMLRLSAGGNSHGALLGVLPRERLAPCPARTASVTVGPDGLLYPCPAYYHLGEEFSLGPLAALTAWIEDDKRLPAAPCSVCGDPRCPGCRLIESGALSGKDSVCQLSQAHRRVARALMKQASTSGYLFAGLRALETTRANKAHSGRPELLQASRHRHDVQAEEFSKALRHILQTISAAGAPADGKLANSGWQPPADAPKHSRKAVFYDAVSGILSTINSLKRAGTTAVAADADEAPLRLRSPGSRGATVRPRAVARLSEGDIAAGTTLYERVLAWDYVVQWIGFDKIAGFAVQREEGIAAQGLKLARQAWADWLNAAVSRCRVAPARRTALRVDLERGEVISMRAPCAFYQAGPRPQTTLIAAAEAAGGEHIMYLNRADGEVIQRSVETRDAAGDDVRRHMMLVAEGHKTPDALHESIGRLGSAIRGVERWFIQMAREYAWPAAAAGYSVPQTYDEVVALGGIVRQERSRTARHVGAGGSAHD